jgi:hypothetical protein
MSKDFKKLTKKIRSKGWDVRQRRSGHYVIEGPNGEKVFCSATPSDHRSLRNIERDLVKAGLDIRE